jgi:hypothetical protein
LPKRTACCAAAAVLLAGLSRPARAQDEDGSLSTRIASVLEGRRVGGLSLREHLVSLDFRGCLQDARIDLLAGLDDLRGVHRRAVEQQRSPAVWRAWSRALDGLSPDAWLLVSTWLDSPETARRLYLCEDGLPASWRALPPDDYVLEAVAWFDASVAEREKALRATSPGDREAAVMALMELRAGLLERYRASYPDDGPHRPALDRLGSRLGLMWDALVEPWDQGFSPRARTEDPAPDASGMGRARFQSPFTGMAIPDPKDVAARDAVAAGWRRQKDALQRDLRERQAELDESVTRLAVLAAGPELDRALRDAARVSARLASAVASIERMQDGVRHFSTGRPWVDGMLDDGYRRRAVRRLERQQSRAQEARTALEAAIAAAVERGAAPPGKPREAEPGRGGATGGTGIASGGDVRSGTPGPGNWLAGLPGADRRAVVSSEQAGRASGPEPIPEGSGWVERVYEGPLPPPSEVWSGDLVRALRQRLPSLDETDARILLSLVREAYSELPDRASVERAVWRSLADPAGLQLRGEEATLSDLYRDGRPRSEQPVVTFVLRLLF